MFGQKPRPALLYGMPTQRRLKTFASQGGLPSLRRSKSWHENLFTLKQTQQSSDTASDSTTKLAQIQIEDLEARADTVKALIARLSALLLEEDVNFPKWIADWEIQHKQLEVSFAEYRKFGNEQIVEDLIHGTTTLGQHSLIRLSKRAYVLKLVTLHWQFHPSKIAHLLRDMCV